jgi:hypothetical protein
VGIKLAGFPDDLFVKRMPSQPVNGDDDRFVHLVTHNYSNENFSLATNLAHFCHLNLPPSLISNPQKFPFSQKGLDAGYGFFEFTDSVRSFNDSLAYGFLLVDVEKFPVSVFQFLNQFGVAHLPESCHLLCPFRHE